MELNPDERLLRIPLIQHLQAAGNWDEAVRTSKTAIEIFPRDFDLALLHVRSLNELERYEESIRIMQDIQVLPSEPRSKRISYFLTLKSWLAWLLSKGVSLK